jgi:hypothetical protein
MAKKKTKNKDQIICSARPTRQSGEKSSNAFICIFGKEVT